MLTGQDHFKKCSREHLHLDYHFDVRMRRVEDIVPSLELVANENNYHFAHIKGDGILNGMDLSKSIFDAYGFRNEKKMYYRSAEWDEIAYGLSNLSWLYNGKKGSFSGFMLVYSDPEYMFVQDPLEFILGISVITKETSFFLEKSIPFHFVITPVSLYMSSFIDVSISNTFICTSCLRESSDKYMYVWD